MTQHFPPDHQASSDSTDTKDISSASPEAQIKVVKPSLLCLLLEFEMIRRLISDSLPYFLAREIFKHRGLMIRLIRLCLNPFVFRQIKTTLH